jgi:hypothetical protein
MAPFSCLRVCADAPSPLQQEAPYRTELEDRGILGALEDQLDASGVSRGQDQDQDQDQVADDDSFLNDDLRRIEGFVPARDLQDELEIESPNEMEMDNEGSEGSGTLLTNPRRIRGGRGRQPFSNDPAYLALSSSTAARKQWRDSATPVEELGKRSRWRKRVEEPFSNDPAYLALSTAARKRWRNSPRQSAVRLVHTETLHATSADSAPTSPCATTRLRSQTNSSGQSPA